MKAAVLPAIDVVMPVFNGEDRIRQNVQHLLDITDSAASDIRVLVCDDGSSDATAKILGSVENSRLRVVRLPTNSGRAIACNQATSLGNGDYLLFLDADCQPEEKDFFAILGQEAATGAGLVYGPIVGTGEGFWHRYLAQVEQRRYRQAMLRRHLSAMTTGNLLVRRSLFIEAGGFCEAYRHYGFEDKDLIIRLLALEPRVVFDPRLVVLHDAGNTVAGYCRKMREAACHTAPVFYARNPDTYRNMAFARLDPDLTRQPLRGIMRGLGRYGAGSAEKIAAWALTRSRLPWSLQTLLVRSASAFSYLQGAADRRSH